MSITTLLNFIYVPSKIYSFIIMSILTFLKFIYVLYDQLTRLTLISISHKQIYLWLFWHNNNFCIRNPIYIQNTLSSQTTSFHSDSISTKIIFETHKYTLRKSSRIFFENRFDDEPGRWTAFYKEHLSILYKHIRYTLKKYKKV